MRLKLSLRERRDGFTLIELMTVIVIIAIMTALMIPEMRGTFQDALLRSNSRKLIDVFGLAYSRAVSLNQMRRVQLDEKSGRYLVEKQVSENGLMNFVPAEDMPDDKGTLDPRVTITFHRPDELTPKADAMQGPTPDETLNSPTTINFYPDGTASAGEIEMRDRDGFGLLLHINPITARVHIVEIPRQ